MKQSTPIALVRAVIAACATLAATTSCIAASDESSADDTSNEDLEGKLKADLTSCSKTVYVHIGNFNFFEAPAGGNGCWGYERIKANNQPWTECHYNSSWPVKNWGPTTQPNWVYNETAFTHTAGGPEGAVVDKCYGLVKDHINATPPGGVLYMMYQGSSGWNPTNAVHVKRRFAELYGANSFYPFFDQWKANPVGRPMVNVTPDETSSNQVYNVVKNVCKYIGSGTWMGLYSNRDTRNTDWRMHEIVNALNDCTTGK